MINNLNSSTPAFTGFVQIRSKDAVISNGNSNEHQDDLVVQQVESLLQKPGIKLNPANTKEIALGNDYFVSNHGTGIHIDKKNSDGTKTEWGINHNIYRPQVNDGKDILGLYARVNKIKEIITEKIVELSKKGTEKLDVAQLAKGFIEGLKQ